jgi:hypothetical protein
MKDIWLGFSPPENAATCEGMNRWIDVQMSCAHEGGWCFVVAKLQLLSGKPN